MPLSVLPVFDHDLLRRYDGPGPRYTSYPTAPHFDARFGAADYRRHARASNDDPVPSPLSVYVHVPFCHSACYYCGCTRIIARNPERGREYIERLGLEIDLQAKLFDRDRLLTQIHFGGGTPNFLGSEGILAVMARLESAFSFDPEASREYSVELDPRHADAQLVADIAAAGINRISLGIQDFDADVQKAVNRIQSVEQTAALIEAARSNGMRSTNVDLIYGLPRQNQRAFGQTLDTVIGMRPDRIATYSYAHLPNHFKAQNQIRAEDLPSAEEKLGLLELAIDKLCGAGYVYIGMDHFALPDDELVLAQERGGLHRNFQGYSTRAECDLIGLGMSSIGKIGHAYVQNAKDLPAYYTPLLAGQLPIVRGYEMTAQDRIIADAIQSLMCHCRLVKNTFGRRHDLVFDEYFASELTRLAPLAADGLVNLKPDCIEITARGRLLMRVVAMCFDRHLHQSQVVPHKFSRVV
ncbi:MAG: oxygen-independent coproporphyrinogen III oxidase [Xanthomonadales bacterium]|nr:oxygen-independent coproporphyrinogen III oxidase [Xanthomonadales bacterium]MCC6561212.1 oxygen-independent coproporphyrinogen III oxidase [Xanthomonadales bacterium]